MRRTSSRKRYRGKLINVECGNWGSEILSSEGRCWLTRFSEAWRAPRGTVRGSPRRSVNWSLLIKLLEAPPKAHKRCSLKCIKSAALNNGVMLLDFAIGINLFSEDHEEARLC